MSTMQLVSVGSVGSSLGGGTALPSPPPVSNTGGKIVRTGNKEKLIGLGLGWESTFVTIDTFSFSFDGSAFGFDVGRMRKWMDWFSGGIFTVGGLLQQRYNGYYQCYKICLVSGLDSMNLGFLGFSLPTDNMKGRCFINLTGVACELMQPSHWASLYSVCEEFDIKITRCDIAYDDYDGLHPVSEAREIYESGGFNAGGRRPSARYIDSYGSGDTFYVGKRQNGKMLRVYEKGKQLGDRDSRWVRWELQLGCKDRVIPYEVLLTPLAFLRGAYPVALSWLVDVVARGIKTVKRKAGIIFDKAILFARRQAGRVIRYCRDILGMADESIVDELIAKEGRYPLRLTGVVAGNLCHVAY